jgi:site-specific DNA-methyltransferase (adenine-specific)
MSGKQNARRKIKSRDSAARFASFPQDVQRIFYTAKAGADDRLGSKHPTVKPLDLIQYLVRLVTPPGGVCLDLFAGTGTTGEAAFREGFRAILIEREAEYLADIERRMGLVTEGPVTRANAGMKARGRPRDDGPLLQRRSPNDIDA